MKEDDRDFRAWAWCPEDENRCRLPTRELWEASMGRGGRWRRRISSILPSFHTFNQGQP
jgi:hypothetical protein